MGAVSTWYRTRSITVLSTHPSPHRASIVPSPLLLSAHRLHLAPRLPHDPRAIPTPHNPGLLLPSRSSQMPTCPESHSMTMGRGAVGSCVRRHHRVLCNDRDTLVWNDVSFLVTSECSGQKKIRHEAGRHRRPGKGDSKHIGD